MPTPPLPPSVLAAAERIRSRVSARTTIDWLPHTQQVGQWVWQHGYGAGATDDLDALRRVALAIRELPATHPSAPYLKDCIEIPTAAVDLLSCGLWVESACPIVMTTHRYAASCVCTHLPDDFDLRSPWRSWILEVPDRLIFCVDPETHAERWVRYAHVSIINTESGPRWNVVGMVADSTLQLGTRMVSTQEFLSAFGGDDTEPRTVLEHVIDDTTERAILCLRSLCANVMVTMTDPRSCVQVGKHAANWTRGPRAGAPGHRRFMVSRPVTVDVRDAVTAYCRGGASRTPTVASLVRGFWRHQPHGPAQSLRRLQYIEPHWRGPRDGLVVSPRVRISDQ